MEHVQGHTMQETSLNAYDEMREKLSDRHKEIYEALYELCNIQSDATDFEITKFLKKGDPNYVRPRRNELVNQLKLVGFSQKRPCGITGKKAMAWKILQRRLQ